jgi:hypothetical protein
MVRADVGKGGRECKGEGTRVAARVARAEWARARARAMRVRARAMARARARVRARVTRAARAARAARAVRGKGSKGKGGKGEGNKGKGNKGSKGGKGGKGGAGGKGSKGGKGGKGQGKGGQGMMAQQSSAPFSCVIMLTAAVQTKQQSAILRIINLPLWSTGPQQRHQSICRQRGPSFANFKHIVVGALTPPYPMVAVF